MSREIIEKIKKEIEGFKDKPQWEETGIISEVGDGIARAIGLYGALSQELIYIESAGSSGDIPALLFNLEESSLGLVILGEGDEVKVGDRIKKSGKVLSINASEKLLGRVVDPLGRAIDGKGIIAPDEKAKDMLLEKKAPSVMERESVGSPLHTGIKAIDAMIPIGRGQRELIIGDRQTGKTAVAIDAILNQKQEEGRQVFCIYVTVGQKNSKIAKIVKSLEENDALKYTVIVSAPASSSAAMQYLAPFAGAAIGEYFMEQGSDALVIYDDLSKHADAYRQLSLLLRRPPGREAYPGDIFYLHSRLLERAAKLSKEKGGGSLTALPIVETKLGDVSAYVPTNVISITDGQIYLESSLFYQGIRPAINVGLSVSRVGSAAQTKAVKKVASKLRLELAQFRELKAFVQFASELDENTKKQIKRGELFTEVLKQGEKKPLSFDKESVILYAATGGFMDDIEISRVGEFENKFLDFLDAMHRKTVLDAIRKSGAIDEKTEMNLKSAIEEFKAIFSKK